MSQYSAHPYYFSLEKRIFDLFLSSSVLILLTPFFLIAYPFFIMIAGQPFIFRQKRMGKNKKLFTLYKIRTMKVGSENRQGKLRKLSTAPYPMFKVENDPRFISFGKILSKFGLDELPQVLNIIKGEMSFVGPRPLPVNEAKLLNSSWDFRYEVKPGILSKWALSPNRYESLKKWKELEKETIKMTSSLAELKLIIRAFYKIVIRQFLNKNN